MRVRTDDVRAIGEAWSAYEACLVSHLSALDVGGVLAIELAPGTTDERLVPSVDVYAETGDTLLVSATGNGMLGDRFRMSPSFKKELAAVWTPIVRNDRGVVLWKLERPRSVCDEVAAAVCRVLAWGFRVPHPVWLETRVDSVPAETPDWRVVHQRGSSGG